MAKKEAKCAEKEVKCAEKKEDSPITVVLKLEMHCEGCATKVRRSVKAFDGVEAVASDVSASKLTVIGKVDPLDLRNRVESKTHKKVDLISPVIAIVKEKNSSNSKPDKIKEKEKEKVDDKKRNEPLETSVVLKVRLHCQGCMRRIKQQINKIKGVNGISMDTEKDLVTVKGTMDVNSLPVILTAKLKKAVEIVNQKKDGDGDKEKSGKKKVAEVAKEEAQVVTAAAPPTATVTAVTEANKTEYNGGSYGYGNDPYRFDMVHAPQLFSDENPNACSVM